MGRLPSCLTLCCHRKLLFLPYDCHNLFLLRQQNYHCLGVPSRFLILRINTDASQILFSYSSRRRPRGLPSPRGGGLHQPRRPGKWRPVLNSARDRRGGGAELRSGNEWKWGDMEKGKGVYIGCPKWTRGHLRSLPACLELQRPKCTPFHWIRL